MVERDPPNARLADELALYAALLELAEASPFAARAYLRAADLIRSTPGPVAELVRSGRIRELRGIGPGIEAKLRELVETGEIAELRALEEELEPALVGFGRLLGVGGKRTAARALGYEYLAICDHTPNVRVVPGLDADALRRQGEEIAEVNALLEPFRVLRGVECDIRPDGTLDAEENALAELDWVQLSLHAGQRRPGSELTRMVTEAMRTPYVRALSHPKGRILERRPENALDLDEVFAVALETGVALEVNGLPDRLDLSGTHVERRRLRASSWC